MAFVLQQFTVADFRVFKRVLHGVSDENEVNVRIEYDSAANTEQSSLCLASRSGRSRAGQASGPCGGTVMVSASRIVAGFRLDSSRR